MTPDDAATEAVARAIWWTPVGTGNTVFGSIATNQDIREAAIAAITALRQQEAENG